jgi:hypothetical protein
MNKLGFILLLIFVALALFWAGFLSGRTYRTHSINKCAKGFAECMFLLDVADRRLNECRLQLPRQP